MEGSETNHFSFYKKPIVTARRKADIGSYKQKISKCMCISEYRLYLFVESHSKKKNSKLVKSFKMEYMNRHIFYE